MSAPAGQLDKQVILQSPGGGQNAFGERDGAWTDVATAWAGIAPTSPQETVIAKGFAASVSHKITLRYRSDVNTTWRIMFGSRVFSINGLINPLERNDDLIVYATEVV